MSVFICIATTRHLRRCIVIVTNIGHIVFIKFVLIADIKCFGDFWILTGEPVSFKLKKKNR